MRKAKGLVRKTKIPRFRVHREKMSLCLLQTILVYTDGWSHRVTEFLVMVNPLLESLFAKRCKDRTTKLLRRCPLSHPSTVDLNDPTSTVWHPLSVRSRGLSSTRNNGDLQVLSKPYNSTSKFCTHPESLLGFIPEFTETSEHSWVRWTSGRKRCPVRYPRPTTTVI